MMQMASLMVPLHSLGQDDQNEVKMTSGDVMPLALALSSHDVEGIINGTSALVRSKQLK